MSFPYPDSTNPYPQGWTCDKCGVFVPYGTYHGCSVGNQPFKFQSFPIQYNFADNVLLERIISVLERIEKLLKYMKYS